jgi:hypothetical protein
MQAFEWNLHWSSHKLGVIGAQLILYNFFMHIEEYHLKDSTQKSTKTAILTLKIFSDHQPQRSEVKNSLQLLITT